MGIFHSYVSLPEGTDESEVWIGRADHMIFRFLICLIVYNTINILGRVVYSLIQWMRSYSQLYPFVTDHDLKPVSHEWLCPKEDLKWQGEKPPAVPCGAPFGG